jgi:hypothetical protein
LKDDNNKNNFSKKYIFNNRGVQGGLELKACYVEPVVLLLHLYK